MLGMTKARFEEIRGPTNIATAKSSPRLGIARAELAVVTSQRERPVCPTQSPSGMATAAARSSDSAE